MSILEPGSVTPHGPDTETPELETDTVAPSVTSRPGAGPLSNTLGLTSPDLDLVQAMLLFWLKVLFGISFDLTSSGFFLTEGSFSLGPW